MNALMKQMGMSQEDIDALRVVIEKEDGGKIVIENPSVVKVRMQGQESFQISGDVAEADGNEDSEESFGLSEEDVQAVMEKTGCTEDEARDALEETEDLAEAILKLS